MWHQKLAKKLRRWKMRANVFHSEQQKSLHRMNEKLKKKKNQWVWGWEKGACGEFHFFPKIISLFPVIRFYISTSSMPALVMGLMWLMKLNQGHEPLPKRSIKRHVLPCLSWAHPAQVRAVSSVWIPQWSGHQAGSQLIQGKWKAGIRNKLAFMRYQDLRLVDLL